MGGFGGLPPAGDLLDPPLWETTFSKIFRLSRVFYFVRCGYFVKVKTLLSAFCFKVSSSVLIVCTFKEENVKHSQFHLKRDIFFLFGLASDTDPGIFLGHSCLREALQN